MSVYVEVQNATLTKETVNYVAESGNVEAHKVFLPLATIGLEAAR